MASRAYIESRSISADTVECVKREGMTPAVADALEALRDTSSNYGEYAFEFSPRNLATDEAGNLILLDVMFDAVAVERMYRQRRGF